MTLVGPRFFTGDPQRPWAAALVVRDGRIVEVLDERPEPGSRDVLELPGAVAVPGLVDAHAHLLGLGLAHRRADLVGLATREATLDAVRRFAREHPDDPWVLGRGWDQNDWPRHDWPTADELQQVVPDRPAALWRIDGHALWVNRTALERAGIDTTTPDPEGGTIVRDAGGRPTGLLIDNATELVAKAIPPPDERTIAEALERAAQEMLRVGLTGIHDMGMTEAEFDQLIRLQEAGRFPLRVFGYADAADPLRARIERDGPIEAGRIVVAGVKLFADGALGSRGARLLEPYADAPRSQGLWVTSPEHLAREVEAILASGLQPAIHAIGDAANRAALDAIEAAYARHPEARALRARIEHVQVLAAADVPRFAAEGIVASMQPTHATSDMPWAGARLGPERLRFAYAWRTLLDAGARLAFGSDAPVESIDPRRGLYAAVTRQDEHGRPPGGFLPAQRLTLAEALAAFTSGAAFAARREDRLGRIAPGYFCDLTVFGDDPFALTPQVWRELPVVAVVIEGHVFLGRSE